MAPANNTVRPAAVLFTRPGLAIASFVTVGAILLIVVSVATLFALPRRSTAG